MDGVVEVGGVVVVGWFLDRDLDKKEKPCKIDMLYAKRFKNVL